MFYVRFFTNDGAETRESSAHETLDDAKLAFEEFDNPMAFIANDRGQVLTDFQGWVYPYH